MSDDQYDEAETQRRVETLVRAMRRPPVHRKDLPRKRDKVRTPEPGLSVDMSKLLGMAEELREIALLAPPDVRNDLVERFESLVDVPNQFVTHSSHVVAAGGAQNYVVRFEP